MLRASKCLQNLIFLSNLILCPFCLTKPHHPLPNLILLNISMLHPMTPLHPSMSPTKSFPLMKTSWTLNGLAVIQNKRHPHLMKPTDAPTLEGNKKTNKKPNLIIHKLLPFFTSYHFPSLMFHCCNGISS